MSKFEGYRSWENFEKQKIINYHLDKISGRIIKRRLQGKRKQKGVTLMEMYFETNKKLFDFIERFCRKRLISPSTEDESFDEKTGSFILVWEGSKFVINHKLDVKEEIKEVASKGIEKEIGEKEFIYFYQTPSAKLLHGWLKEFYCSQKNVESMVILCENLNKGLF